MTFHYYLMDTMPSRYQRSIHHLFEVHGINNIVLPRQIQVRKSVAEQHRVDKVHR